MSDRPLFRHRLHAGEMLFGTMVTVPSCEVAEILGEAGFDWLCLDAEHGALTVERVQGLIRAVGAGSACIVRVPALDEAAIKHALDAGAVGVMVPQVHTAELAADAVRWSRYAPQGARGMGVARAHRYGFGVNEYLASANDRTVVVVQAESAEAVRNIDSIVHVPGVDAVLIGPYDLSASLGYPGEVDHPVVKGAIDRIRQVCQTHNLPIGIFGLNVAAVRPYMDQGFRLMLVGVDTVLLGQAARDLLTSARA